MVGDFNAHNTAWGSETTFGKGRVVADVISDLDLNILNTGENTYFDVSTGKFSSIDLSLCDPTTATHLSWTTLDSLYDSDHFPIVITDSISNPSDNVIKWRMTSADWDSYAEEVNSQVTAAEFMNNINQAVHQFTNILISAAEKHIGRITIKTNKKIVPWWNEACKLAVKQCKSALNRYRRTQHQEDLVNFKKLKAVSRRILKESKRKSWMNFVSSISPNTTPAQVWTKIKQIKGQNTTYNIPSILDEKDEPITKSQDIANTLAKHYFEKTVNQDIPQRPKKQAMNIGQSEKTINHPFTLQELKLALSSMRNTAAGPDEIPMIFLKKLKDETLPKLLKLYNNIWTSHQFPKQWQQSHIIPIKKPGKSKPTPNVFRPISLTCTLCKVLEKMVNRRLIWYLEKCNLLHPAQSGFRQNRSTTDNLVILQTEIAHAFANQQDLIAALIDIDSAFDTTSREAILNKLHDIKLDGNVYCFLENFLTDRSFKVLVNSKSSDSFVTHNGIPQGSVLSTTLFILAINDICTVIEAPIKFILYADDLLLFCSGKSTKSTCKLLQRALNSITTWAKTIGFNFSPSKSKLIKFTRRQPTVLPQLTIYDAPIELVDHLDYLGMTFDQKLTWSLHIKKIKGSCMNTMNILRTLSHHHWGCDEEILLKIYRSLIRSRLDYGSMLYSTSSKSNLKLLNSIPNTALRLSLGAFRSSPSISLHVEAQELPLNFRRQQTLLTYISKVSALPNHPVRHLLETSQEPPTMKPMTLLSIPQIAKQNLRPIDVTLTSPITFPKHTPWSRHHPRLNTSLHRHIKLETLGTILKQHLFELLGHEKFDEELYTDASKDEQGIACSIINKSNAPVSYKLPSICSIHTGELFAIYKSLCSSFIPGQKLAILTDSLSSIESIDNIYSKNPLVQQILERCHTLKAKENISTTIIWIPSHIGITGNEAADQAANQARTSELPVTQIQLHTDLKNAIKLRSLQEWQVQWEGASTGLHMIQPKIHNSPQISLGRKDKTVVRRLRIGHTKLTHSYLMSSENQPKCEHCHNTRLTVEHLLSICPYYGNDRRRLGLRENLGNILNSQKQIELALKFLKECQLYNNI